MHLEVSYAVPTHNLAAVKDDRAEGRAVVERLGALLSDLVERRAALLPARLVDQHERPLRTKRLANLGLASSGGEVGEAHEEDDYASLLNVLAQLEDVVKVIDTKYTTQRMQSNATQRM